MDAEDLVLELIPSSSLLIFNASLFSGLLVFSALVNDLVHARDAKSYLLARSFTWYFFPLLLRGSLLCVLLLFANALTVDWPEMSNWLKYATAGIDMFLVVIVLFYVGWLFSTLRGFMTSVRRESK